MDTIQFYTLGIPVPALSSQVSELERNLVADGILEGGTATKSISLRPGQQPIEGNLAGRYAGLMAAEVEGLADAAGYEAVPVFIQDEDRALNGYYTVGDAEVGPMEPEVAAELQQFTIRLTRQGSRRSHWRATRSNPVQPAGGNPAGNSTTGYVGVPSAAEKVRWYNPETQERSQPTVQATRSGEFGDVDLYDAHNGPSYSDPVLIYDLPYSEEGGVDSKVWDTHDRDKLETTTTGATVGSATVGGTSVASTETVNTWQRVFRPSHEPAGTLVVENGLLRLEFRESENQLVAWEWDTSQDAYLHRSLNASDWELFDLDLTRIGQARVDAQVEFRDPSQSPTEYYALDMSLQRGYTDALWYEPANASAGTPSGLLDSSGGRLAPVAAESVVDPQPETGLVSREEARI